MSRDRFGVRVVLGIGLAAFLTSGAMNMAFAGSDACKPVKACEPVKKIVLPPVHACEPVKIVAPPVHACAPVKACDPVHEHLVALHDHVSQVLHVIWARGHICRHVAVTGYAEPAASPVQSNAPPAPAPAPVKTPAPPKPAGV